ncbi:NADH:ubiquinone oxidoreductase subunit 1 (chain H) [Mycolicibacterium chubuense NBB4]|uniref:NADH:ubiquinone oxidoreductase subunit 1 (Chain H) n=1 Tax=Mycolicibacterium chubuense (strain NBB4) TaxID=710421 RepID=I4BLH0_MYCCN|nr:complex I subunit 1 family protein [Mycolicibacterium chubuense]AFM18127.1 NADH:ubiquinone oxidoreductase subunit 1 (chain H) [Mycolicibacterium chubuense NBB4]
MTASTITTVSGVWATVAAALVLALGYYAAALDSGLSGRDVGAAAHLRAPLAESVRLLCQRRRTTVAADRLLWRIGGGGLITVALLMITVVPLGRWTLFDSDVGIVWFNAMDVCVWALVWLAGWGPNSIHPLIGGYRFLAQALGYELPLMFALVGPAIAAASLRVGTVADAQHGLWYGVWMPVAFGVYLLAVTGFSVWGPLSAAVGADISGGVAAELSGVDRLLWSVGRYTVLAAGSAFSVPLFLGGGAGPVLPEWLWVLVKTVAVLTFLVWVRRRLPILRPDRFMEVGWLVLLPAVLVQDLVVAVVTVWR